MGWLRDVHSVLLAPAIGWRCSEARAATRGDESAGDEEEMGASGILRANNEIKLGERLLWSWNVR